MLCIALKRGDYFTVGGETVVQFEHLSGERVHLAIHAPREIPILRGEVLERTGGARPSCIYDTRRRGMKQLPWNYAKKAALAQLRQTLDQMDDSPEVRTAREKLDFIFPQPADAGKKGAEGEQAAQSTVWFQTADEPVEI